MKVIFLPSLYKPLITSNYSFLLSNELLNKDLDFKKKKIKYKFISSIKQNYQTRYESEIETNEIAKKIEFDLYKNLNLIHSTNFSNRYWKIIVGHWVLRFIKLIHFRYQILDDCFKKNYNFDFTYASRFANYSQATNNTNDLWRCCSDEEWNYNLFSKILEISFLNKCEIKHFSTKNLFYSSKFINLPNTMKDILKNKIQILLSSFNLLGKNNNIVFKNTYLSLYNEIKLSFLNREYPVFLNSRDYKSSDINLQKRNKINLNSNVSNNLEHLARKLIPDALPKIVIEDYKEILNLVSNSNWPENPKVIFTSNSYDTDDIFKIWAAEKIEKKNSKYIIGQHGLFDSSEKLLNNSNDYQISDQYLRWGEKKYNKDIELFNFKIINKKINSKNNNILILHRTAGHDVEPYSRSNEFKIYNSCLESLLENFSSYNKDKIILRLKRNYRWTNPGEFDVLNKKFPTIKIDDGRTNFFSHLKSAKLAIFLYYSTGALEALTLNVPVVFYYPKNLIYTDPKEKFYINLLNECKILAYTEEEFKNNIEIILSNPSKWWSNDLVRKAREIFCFRYSRAVPKDPILKISKLLRSFI